MSTANQNIKNLLFDFAGVIMNLNLERDTKSLMAAGLPDWKGCMADKELKHILLLFLNGLISWEYFLPLIKPFCKDKVTEQELYNAMHDVLDDVPKSRLDWIISLRKHYKVFLLSNISDISWQICKQRIETTGHSLEECFDKVFLSFEMKLAKPDEKTYREMFAQANINPEETLYFDDTKENILAGRKLGMESILVEMNKLENTKFYQMHK